MLKTEYIKDKDQFLTGKTFLALHNIVELMQMVIWPSIQSSQHIMLSCLQDVLKCVLEIRRQIEKVVNYADIFILAFFS